MDPQQDALLRLGSDAASSTRCGGKARNLGRLIAGGIPVPEGFVIPPEALGAARSGDLDGLEARARELASTLAVRSSASVEDVPGAAAPGLFRSVVGVRPADLPAAIEEVAASAERPAARAYSARRGRRLSIAVVVQRYVAPDIAGVLYSRAPGDPEGDHMVFETHGERPAHWSMSREGQLLAGDPALPDEPLQTLLRLALRAEAAIGADRGADVEWVLSGDDIWIVQARPIVHPPPTSREVKDALAFSERDPDTLWVLDATHNPDPLSPAQISLVERASRTSSTALRVVSGYLYAADTHRPPAPSRDVEDILREIDGSIAPALEATLGRGEPGPTGLDEALDIYSQVNRIYSDRLRPLVAAARAAHADKPPQRGSQPFARALALTRAGRMSRAELLELIGAAAPAWDVAVPTFREREALVDSAIARCHAIDLTSSGDSLAERLEALGEMDDLWFFRAQAIVRTSLLALGRRLGIGDDVFFVALDELAGAPDPEQLRARAADNRATWKAQRALSMPLAFRAGRPAAIPLAAGEDVWTGVGSGGSAEGVVRRIDALDSQGVTSSEGVVIVTRAATPATLLSVVGAAAIVCEHGGQLGHAAAMARELEIPCVVGCRGAWHDLRDGDRVLVDGYSGAVVRI